MNGNDARTVNPRLPHRRPVSLLLLTLVVAMPEKAAAQRSTVTINVLEPAEALAKLASGERTAVRGATNVISAAFSNDVRDGDLLRVGNYDRYTDTQREELLDGLERMASGDLEVPRRALQGAHTSVTIIMHPKAPTPDRWKREIPRRLLRIYRGSQTNQNRTAKALVVSSLGDALGLGPPEAPAIEQALYEVATGPSVPDSPGWVAPESAVQALIHSGQAGVPTLRRLHEEGEVQDMMLTARLRILAEDGYPVRRRWAPGGPPGP